MSRERMKSIKTFRKLTLDGLVQFRHTPTLKRLTRLDDIQNRTWPNRLQIFQKRSRIPPVRIWRVNALRGKVVEFLEIGVHDDFLFVGVFEGFGSGERFVGGCFDKSAALETGKVAAENFTSDM